MVDWDRVEELRSKGWDWTRIAQDPKVDFHAASTAGEPGRQLRALYHRSRARERARGSSTPAAGGSAGSKRTEETRWNLLRIFYLLVPVLGVWFVFAYFVPSPIGLLLPAIPWLGLVLAVAAIVLVWTLWRATRGPRWTKTYRNTVVGGVIVGIVVAGGIGLTYSIALGCPLLPPSSSLSPLGNSGWSKVPTGTWQESGQPVVYFYGATWCPYCSASSWALWKALTEFGSVSGTYTYYSYGAPEPYQYTPEMVLSGASMGAKNGNGPAITFQVSEYNGGSDGTTPSTSSCFQQAYVSAYASGIPFFVVNGQYMHDGTLYNPSNLSAWSNGANGGAASVQTSVSTESAVQGGNPWQVVQNQAWWIMAFIVLSLGGASQISTLHSQFGWSTQTTSAVTNYTNQIG